MLFSVFVRAKPHLHFTHSHSGSTGPARTLRFLRRAMEHKADDAGASAQQLHYPLCYEAGPFHHKETYPNYELTCSLTCSVRAECYEEQADGSLRRHGSHNSDPLLRSGCGLQSIRQQAEKQNGGELRDLVLGTVNFGDEACLRPMFLGCFDFECLSSRSPPTRFLEDNISQDKRLLVAYVSEQGHQVILGTLSGNPDLTLQLQLPARACILDLESEARRARPSWVDTRSFAPDGAQVSRLKPLKDYAGQALVLQGFEAQPGSYDLQALKRVLVASLGLPSMVAAFAKRQLRRGCRLSVYTIRDGKERSRFVTKLRGRSCRQLLVIGEGLDNGQREVLLLRAYFKFRGDVVGDISSDESGSSSEDSGR